MNWIDVTLPMSSQCPGWPGDTPFRHSFDAVIGVDGSELNLSSIQCGVHFGTHLDAPYHFLENGLKIDEIPLDWLVGPCLVVGLERQQGMIMVTDLEGKVPAGTSRLLVKTCNSDYIKEADFRYDYLAFSPEAAGWLADRGVRLLGLDYFSIGPWESYGVLTHQVFFKNNNTVALEGVDLSLVEPGEYHIICLPMKIKGSDGAPARVLLGR